jgi:hypothetical protein
MAVRLISSILVFLCTSTFAQKTLLVEKIGTSRKYYYHMDDKIKLRTITNDSLIKGKLTSIDDSAISVSTGLKAIPVSDIGLVYKQYGFPRRLGIKLGEAGMVYFLIITFNNLINKEQVFTPYTYIITGSCFAGGLISYSLKQHRCKIGDRWKLKILDFTVK